MNLELFIARRLVSGKESKGLVARSLVNITTFGISLGLAVMIISIAVVTGFKKQVSNKVIGFGAHIHIENFDSNSSFETNPITKDQEFLPELEKLPGIAHIQTFGIKAGIIMTKSDFVGVVMKGVDTDYDWSFFRKNLVAGNIPEINDSAISNQMLISKYIARLLKLEVGQDVAMYFVQNTRKVRRMHVAGIYETGLEEFDKMYVISDIKQIRQLNDWTGDQISGFEISITNFKKLDEMKEKINSIVGLDLQKDGSALLVSTIKEKYPQIFDWLNLQDLNVYVILVIMLLVAGCIMISGLLILILERTKMIGLLTALGAEESNIRNIFLYQSVFLILRGLLLGNIIGLGICTLQYHFHFIKLDQASYYINSVPIHFNFLLFGLLNVGTLVIIMSILIFPSLVIAKISPDITLRYN